MAREALPGDKRLIAYYTADPDDNTIETEQLRAHLMKLLPEYMVPAAYVNLTEFPLTQNGKLDRNALPEADGASYATRGYEPPQGVIETRLADIWAELLQLERVGRHDNFFDLGGHSLLAVRVSSMLNQANIEMTVVDLFQHPTIKQLSSCLQHTKSAMGVKGSIPIRTTGSQRPLFLIHEYTGLDLWFPVIAEHVAPDIPIYGLPGVPLSEPQLQTMEGMATRLVRIIREIQPDGPYRLAGWSYGGILAYEIAVQLIGQDQIVEFLGLIDSTNPIVFKAHNRKQLNRNKSPQHCLLELYVEEALSVQQRRALEELKKTADEIDFEGLIRKCHEAGLSGIIDDYDASDIKRFAGRLSAHHHALDHYAIQRIPIPVYLFSSEEKIYQQENRSKDDLLMGWDTILPKNQIKRIQVPGNHFTMMETPHINVLGQTLSLAIAQASGKHPSSIAEMNYRSHMLIQTGKPDITPIFCIPGAGDNVGRFFELADAVGNERPVHGLQPRGGDGFLLPHITVEAAAFSYLEEINTIQPNGSLHLIGHSFGGWVALEIAHQMRAKGRSVASLTLLDSPVPDAPFDSEYTHISVLKELIHALEMGIEKSFDIDRFELETLDEFGQMKLLHSRMVQEGLMPKSSKAETLCGTIRTFGAALRTSYRPQRIYPDPLFLVRVNDKALDQQANRYLHHEIVSGWNTWAPNLTHWLCPGNHITVLNPPYVKILADRLRSVFEGKAGVYE